MGSLKSSKIPVTPSEGLDSTTDRSRKLLWRWIVLGVLALILLVLIFLTQRKIVGNAILLGYLAALLGGLVGAGELIGRYRDSPFGSLGRNPSFVYLAVNALAAATAFSSSTRSAGSSSSFLRTRPPRVPFRYW
jgi:hypothetical protein